MLRIEKDILLFISRIRYMTENQADKVFTTKTRYGRKPFKKMLRKMCNECTLRKYPCNINYRGYKDNSYVYYLNGSKTYKGKDLAKVLIGSELAIRIDLAGYNLKRFYRNIKIGNNKYDLYIEYVNTNNDIKQILVDIDIDDKIDIFKYKSIVQDINKSTIPFISIPKLLIITPTDVKKLHFDPLDCDLNFVDMNLSKLFKYI